jgi:hypothetical protein
MLTVILNGVKDPCILPGIPQMPQANYTMTTLNGDTSKKNLSKPCFLRMVSSRCSAISS